MLNRSQIESRVPHAGAMCLLDAVTRWDATRIECRAAAPMASHPLARGDGVPAVAAIEYAAQATAVHGSLLEGGASPVAGMLATVSEVELASECMVGPLDIRAELRSRVAAGCLYGFSVHDAHRCCARGTLLVALRQ